jgi:hypothetical protein
MNQYGQVINPFYDPVKDSVYKSFAYYFDNPNMTKLREDAGNDVYAAQTPCHLSNSYRYLLLTCERTQDKIGDTTALENLKWNSLQTRNLFMKYEVNTFLYQPKRVEPFNAVITRKKGDDTIYTYENEDLPFLVSLLPKNKRANEYNSKGTVISCIETYETIITFK